MPRFGQLARLDFQAPNGAPAVNGFDVILAVTDSYGVGVHKRETFRDRNARGVFQWRSYPGDPKYRTIDPKITPLSVGISDDEYSNFLSPMETFCRHYYRRTGRPVLIVPWSFNGTKILDTATTGWASTTAGHHPDAITEANACLSYLAANGYPGSQFAGIYHWLGTNDTTSAVGSVAGYTRAGVVANLPGLISDFRSGITGASACWVLINGMMPEYYMNTAAKASVIEFGLRDVWASLGGNVYFNFMPSGWFDTNSTNLHPNHTGSRESGLAAARLVLGETTVPQILSPAAGTLSVFAGQKLYLPLVTDQPCRFTIGGADASSVEIVEEVWDYAASWATAYANYRYYVRFTGDTTHTSGTTYNFTVTPVNGANQAGSSLSYSVPVLAAYGSASAGAVTIALSHPRATFSNASSAYTDRPNRFPGVTFGAGMNLIKLEEGNGATTISRVVVNNTDATLWSAGTGADGTMIWLLPLAVGGVFDADVYTAGAGQTITNPAITVVTLTNTLATPTDLEKLSVGAALGSGTKSYTVAAGGIVVSFNTGAVDDTVNSGTTYLVGPTGSSIAYRTTTGTITLTRSGGGVARTFNSLYFDKAP